MDLEKNIYGLSKGVFKACQFLGLKFPPEAVNNPQPVPSDYFGDDFELDSAMIKKLCAQRKWTKAQFDKVYKNFAAKYNLQKCFPKRTKTDLNIYFCDHALFSKKHGANIDNYFDFEFYRKSFALRNTFRVGKTSAKTQMICNDFFARELLLDKSKANKIFVDFLHRDWLDTRTCTFEDFKIFVKRHNLFFSKPAKGAQGKGAEIVNINSDEDFDKIFENLKGKRRILEEIVTQHKDIATICPDTVNTIRICTILDTHNVVHILTVNGRFGRLGGVVDNVHVGGGVFVSVDPKTGIIISDGLTNSHERIKRHSDTGKTFKGFRYPCWEKVLELVQKAAKLIPQLRHVGWDIAVNDKNEVIIIEANGNAPALDLQQAADSVGRLPLYEPLLNEIQNYKAAQLRLLGYRVNNIPDFNSAYNTILRKDTHLQFAISKLIPDCKSLMDLGCRKPNFVKSITPPHVAKYYPVDYKKYTDEVILCNFNKGEFPDIKADTCLCAFTAEYVERLPQFLSNMCNTAQKQILMWCRPADKERNSEYRWKHPFLTDFTEEFLIETMKQNNFQLKLRRPDPKRASMILYDFRKI